MFQHKKATTYKSIIKKDYKFNALEEKLILFQDPLRLNLSHDQVLLKLCKSKKLLDLYLQYIDNKEHVYSKEPDSVKDISRAQVKEPIKYKFTSKEQQYQRKDSILTKTQSIDTIISKQSFHDKIQINNIYLDKFQPSKQIEFDIKNDFKEVKPEYKKLFEDIYIDIDSNKLKDDIKIMKMKLLHENNHSFKINIEVNTIFKLPVNLNCLLELSLMDYLKKYTYSTRRCLQKINELYVKNSLLNDNNEFTVNRNSLISAIIFLNNNMVNENEVKLYLTDVLGVNTLCDSFYKIEFQVICLASERYFFTKFFEISIDNRIIKRNFKISYNIEQNLLEKLDLELFERFFLMSNENSNNENNNNYKNNNSYANNKLNPYLKNFLLFLTRQAQALYDYYLIKHKNLKAFVKNVYSNEYRIEPMYIKQ